jgi:ABC-2 type transport system permease protein
MSIVAFFAGLAAIGFGVLIGTIAKTHEQAAPFGATSVVILAAVGGLWFPVFAMPESMQMMARISPMNWGLEGFYDVLLRDVGLVSLLPNLLLLLIFFIINITIAVAYEKKTNQV